MRAHPGVLKVTAANKFKYAYRMDLSYSNTLAESYRLSLRPQALADNRTAVADLLGRLEPATAPERLKGVGHLYFGGPDGPEAVQDFLRRFRVLDNVVDGDKMASYIAAQADRGSLRAWTVVLVSRAGGGPVASVDVGGRFVAVNVTVRTQAEGMGEARPEDSYWIRKNHIISPEHEGLDLNSTEYDAAFKRTQVAIAERHKAGTKDVKAPTRPSGEMMRLVRGAHRALLLIYPLTYDEIAAGEGEPVMGYAVSFPVIEGDVKVPYWVNEQFQKDRFDYAEEAEEVIDDA